MAPLHVLHRILPLRPPAPAQYRLTARPRRPPACATPPPPAPYGSCMFVQKVLAVQAAGAVAAVVVNTDSDELMSMGTDQKGSQSDIPAVLVPGRTGVQLLSALGYGTTPAGVGPAGDGSARLRLYGTDQGASGDGSAHAQHAEQQQTQQGRQQQQQVELLMSQHAQVWLFNKVAASGGADPSAAFSRILAQLQAHFAQRTPPQAAAP